MSNDNIGDRFKAYEACFDITLPRRMPMIIRVDGRAFHSLKLEKPFDPVFYACMERTAEELCKQIQGAVLAYFQSDEISIVARDDVTINTEAWCGKRLNKVLSLSAAIATAIFNNCWGSRTCHFDSRAFIVPDLNEIINYIIWRQQDATRNSVSMCAHAEFSHATLHGVNVNGMLDLLHEAKKPWETVPTRYKRGTICRPVKVKETWFGEEVDRRKWQMDYEIPIFTQNRSYIEDLYHLPEKVEVT